MDRELCYRLQCSKSAWGAAYWHSQDLPYDEKASSFCPVHILGHFTYSPNIHIIVEIFLVDELTPLFQLLAKMYNLLLPAGLRKAQTCRYCFYSVVQKWFFCPAEVTRCPDKGEIWHGERPVPNFTFIGAKVWEYSPQNCQNFEFLP